MHPMMRRVNSGSQHGFVADRQIEDAIHTMQAALATRKSQPELKVDDSPIAVMLDFAKAYDSLRRDFLWSSMNKMGFDQEFIKTI